MKSSLEMSRADQASRNRWRPAVGPLLGAHPVLGRRLGHLGPVLVGPGQEEDVVADQAVPAGQGVGVDRGVGVAHVRRVVDVVDGRGDVEARTPPVAYRRPLGRLRPARLSAPGSARRPAGRSPARTPVGGRTPSAPATASAACRALSPAASRSATASATALVGGRRGWARRRSPRRPRRGPSGRPHARPQLAEGPPPRPPRAPWSARGPRPPAGRRGRGQLGQGGRQPAGRLQHHRRALLGGQGGRSAAGARAPCGAGTPRRRTGRSEARSPPARPAPPKGPGTTVTAEPRPGGGGHQPRAGIRHRRGPGVGHHRDRLALAPPSRAPRRPGRSRCARGATPAGRRRRPRPRSAGPGCAGCPRSR